MRVIVSGYGHTLTNFNSKPTSDGQLGKAGHRYYKSYKYILQCFLELFAKKA